MTVTDFIQPSYVGVVWSALSFSSPKIVDQLLADYWMPHSGPLNLAKEPMAFGIEDISHLVNLLRSSRRRCLIIWVMRKETDLLPLVNPHWPSSIMVGAAVILVSQDSEAESALVDAFPNRFRAVDGSIRIYQPGIKLEEEWGSERHRYYTKY